MDDLDDATRPTLIIVYTNIPLTTYKAIDLIPIIHVKQR